MESLQENGDKVDNIILSFMNEIQQQQQYYNMVNTSKMGDLDVNLITLYARTPALYDKRNPFYKDKQYSERAWNDISMKLGYKVEILKDRMLQLRNRYNLEKRKIETMRSEACPNPKSTWALYKYLLFFDGHIKQRRSYKMLKKIQEAEAQKSRSGSNQQDNSMASSSNNESFHGDLSMLSSLMRERNNSMNDIKSEEESELNMVEAIPILNDDSNDSQIFNFNNANGAKINGNTSTNSSLNEISGGPPPMTMIPQHPYAATTTSTSFDSFANLDKKFHKYNTFGQFIAASLADLSDEKATDVMQRITMEIFAAQRDLN